MVTEETVRQIISKYLRGQATDRERALLENWYYEHGHQHPLQNDDLRFLLTDDAIFEGVRRRAGLPVKSGHRRRLVRWFSSAAALIALALSVTWIFYARQIDKGHEVVNIVPEDIESGGNRAILRLADGRQINLSEMHSGIVVGDNQIVYENGEEELVDFAVDEAVPLVLEAPRGGTYQITLADGTKVWLNAASKLTYPSRFDSEERIVTLEGEAYFAVAKGAARDWPFQVNVDGQSVEVFGTEFNISAYPEEPARTTLVEGSVAVTNQRSSVVGRLLPGEQAIVSGPTLDIKTVDIKRYTAWKDGLFHFKHTPFDELICEVARWYDVEIRYTGSVPKETFSGKMRRSLSLMTALDLLDVSTKAKIQLEGRTLIIQQDLPK